MPPVWTPTARPSPKRLPSAARAAHVLPVQSKPQLPVFRNFTFEQPGEYSILVEIDDEALLATSLTVSN